MSEKITKRVDEEIARKDLNGDGHISQEEMEMDLEFKRKELDQFVESMTNEQLESVMDFFNTMPKLRHVVKVNNPNTKVTSEVIVEGLQNFLE